MKIDETEKIYVGNRNGRHISVDAAAVKSALLRRGLSGDPSDCGNDFGLRHFGQFFGSGKTS